MKLRFSFIFKRCKYSWQKYGIIPTVDYSSYNYIFLMQFLFVFLHIFHQLSVPLFLVQTNISSQ